MKKSELIEMLQKIEGDPEVILSSDAEGNNFSLLTTSYMLTHFNCEASWQVDIFDDEDLEEMSEEEIKELRYGLVLFPY